MAEDNRKRIIGKEFIEAICPVIGIDPSHVTRIVIDAPFGDAVRVYVETFTTKGLLKVAWPSMLKGAEISFGDQSSFVPISSSLPARLGGEEDEPEK